MNESRRLWKEVTRALKFNDIDKATNAKFQVEQKQRDEARDRKVNNADWETKVSIYLHTSTIPLHCIYFLQLFRKESEDSFQYIKPLRGRIL